jgi:PAS domain S-box-containing protein
MKKEFWIMFVPLILFFSLGFYFYNNSEIQMSKNEILIDMSSGLDHIDQIISIEFGSISSDLHYLSTQNELFTILDNNTTTKNLGSDYLAFSYSKEIYDQVRYIDSDGMERVRVNYNVGDPVIVLESQLQNKLDRYYFEDTYKLSESEVFVSPFDLNIEGGVIESPRKPMIRFGTPVYDSMGQKRGIVLLNYLGNNLFDTIDSQVEDIGNTVLLNSEGYWLMGENVEDEWGFMYPDTVNRTFKNTFPDEWGLIQENAAGHFIESGYLYSFTTVYPLLEGQISSSGSSDAFMSSISEVEFEQYNWKIVSYVSVNDFNNMIGVNTTLIYGFYFVCFVIIFVFSWMYANNIEQRRKLVEERQNKIEALHNSALLLNQDQTPSELFSSTITIIEEILGAHWVDLAEPTKEGILVTVSSKNTEKESLIQYDQSSIIVRAFNERKTVFVKDITKDPDYISIVNAVPHRSELVVPVFLGDEIRALINVESVAPTELDELDIQLVEIIALHLTSELERIQRTEEQIRSERILQQSLLAAGAGTFYSDMLKGEIWFSESTEALMGFDPDTFTGTREEYSSLIHPDDQERYFKELEGYIENKYFETQEYRIITKKGETKWIEATGEYLVDESGTERLTGIIKDVTERALTRAELERSNTELESYTYVVSHDLKAPLRSIRTFSDFLLDDNVDQLDDEGKMYLTRIINSASHMDALIGDLLTLSRVGRIHLDVDQVDLNEVLDGVKEDLSATIRERNATINVAELPTIEGQRTWLAQLFTNFITNGMKFNESSNPTIDIGVEETLEEYKFSIIDNGIGIVPENYEKVFGLFERLHSTEEYEGTGAGMAICMKIVEDWGGTLWVESELGQGSSFYFTFPKSL